MDTTPPPSGDPTAAPPPQLSSPNSLDRFFHTLRTCGLFRSDERWIGGVCGGLAQRLGVDPLIVRAAFVLLGLVFGAGVTVYLIAWVLLPDQQGSIILERAIRGGDASSVALLVLTVVVVTSGFGWLWGIGGGAGLPLIIVLAGLVYLLVRQNSSAATPSAPAPGGPPDAQPASSAGSTAVVTYGGAPVATPVTSSSPVHSPGGSPAGGSTPPGAGPLPSYAATSRRTDGPAEPPSWSPPTGWTPPPLPPPRPQRKRLGAGLTMALLGLAAIVGAATTLVLSSTDLSDVAQRLGWTAAAATVGLGVLGAGLAGRRAGLASFTALLLACVAAVTAILPHDLDGSGSAGERYWAPTQATATTYELSFGEGELDLSRLSAPTTPTTIRAAVSVGQLRIRVPDGMSVRINADVDLGDITDDGRPGIDQIGEDRDGEVRDITIGSGTPTLTVEARVGLGEIKIERTP